jgi:hypothetical protein
MIGKFFMWPFWLQSMLKGQMQHIDILKRHLIKIILGNIFYNFISTKNHLIDEGDTVLSTQYIKW